MHATSILLGLTLALVPATSSAADDGAYAVLSSAPAPRAGCRVARGAGGELRAPLWAPDAEGCPVARVAGEEITLEATVGTTTIKATLPAYPALPGQTTLTVNNLTLKSIAVAGEFSPPTFGVGETFQLTAIGTFSDNVTTLDITSQCTWSSKARKVASVSKTGLVTGVKAGTAKIIAAKGRVQGNLTVTVQ